MIKSYILYDENNKVIQFTRCDDTEIEHYNSFYIEIEETEFHFDSVYDYKVESNQVVKIERTDKVYLNQIKKQNMQMQIDNIEINYNGVVYQGDEKSQDRISRAILSMNNDIITTSWKSKYNSWNELTKIDLKQILYLATSKQTEILSTGV